MNVAGIISEYNPFHRGHEYHIAETRRRLGPDCGIIAVMSGNAVQRGDFAVLDKHARAEAALADCRDDGADLVLELPCCCSLAGAEDFARGAVELLDCLGGVVTHLSFGSEAGRLDRLEQVVDVLLSESFDRTLRSLLKNGLSYAAARQQTVEQVLGCTPEMTAPNNILAIEYLKALRLRGSPIRPMTIPRKGAGHDRTAPDGFPSARQLRDLLAEGRLPGEHQMPPRALAVLKRELDAGRAPVSLERCQRAVLARMRTLDDDAFRRSDPSREGLWRRFQAAARSARSMEELLQLVQTRRYPRSRIRRMLLRTYLGMPADLPPRPLYIRPLAFNERGQALLRELSGRASLPVVTKPAQARRLGAEAAALFCLEARVTDLFALAMPDFGQLPGESEWLRSVCRSSSSP